MSSAPTLTCLDNPFRLFRDPAALRSPFSPRAPHGGSCSPDSPQEGCRVVIVGRVLEGPPTMCSGQASWPMAARKMLQYCRRDCASTSRARPHGELSRKRPDDPVTWNAGRLRVTDVRRWPFGCLTLVLVDAAGSPRKVPQSSRCSWTSCPDTQWRAQAGRRQRDGEQRITPASAGVIRTSPAEDCRQLSRRLEGDLLAAGERIVRVLPQLMAHCHTAACTYASPTPSTPWSQPKRHCGNRTCRPRTSTTRAERCACSWTTATTWSPNAPA
jgi:hypothetical protein